MKGRIIEYAANHFYLEILDSKKDWPWSKPRPHWRRAKDWKKPSFGRYSTYVPDMVFKSVAEAEQFLKDWETYPRIVKEIA